MICRILALVALISSLKIPIKQISRFKPYTDETKQKASPISLESVSVKNSYNLQYSAEFRFGTPDQILTLTLDTGSSYIWVPSANCSCHETQHSYDGNKSSTYKNSFVQIPLYYGKGEAKGHIVSDKVSLGNLSVSNQTFVATFYDRDFDGLNSDGLLGLGFKLLSDGVNTFIDNLKEQGIIQDSVFSFYLSNIDNEFRESVFTIGEYDINLYGNGYEKIIEIDPSSGFWLSKLNKFRIGNDTSNIENSVGIIDSGTSTIIIPSDAYSKFTEIVRGINKFCQTLSDGLLVCQCEFGEYGDYPDIAFTFGYEEFIVHAENYIYFALITVIY